jgi:hypothetical protein
MADISEALEETREKANISALAIEKINNTLY